jgi:hypothetical protein
MKFNPIDRKCALFSAVFVIVCVSTSSIAGAAPSGITGVREAGHWYAMGWWASADNLGYRSLGVFGVITAYDVKVNSNFVAEFVNVLFSENPLYWIQVGWIKGDGAVGNTNGKIRFYIESNLPSGYIGTLWGGDVEPLSKHTFLIVDFSSNGDWDIYIDGEWVSDRINTGYNTGLISAQAESTDPTNELTGHFEALKYYNPGKGWTDWDVMKTRSDPPYEVLPQGNNEFWTQGPVTFGVGGVVVLVDKFALLAPYIGLTSTIIVASVVSAVYVKRVKRRREKQ